jgi:hypothetical protein
MALERATLHEQNHDVQYTWHYKGKVIDYLLVFLERTQQLDKVSNSE